LGSGCSRCCRSCGAPVRAAERALYGPGSWRAHIDEAAAVDYVLLQELFKNQDAYLGSTYVAVVEGKLVFGPLWDFGIAGGNAGRGVSLTRWPVLRQPLWPATKARGSHGAEVDFLRRWMSRRIAWMDRQLR
jgi:hypothetical protein